MLTLQQFRKTVLLRRHISFVFTPVTRAAFLFTVFPFFFPPYHVCLLYADLKSKRLNL